MFLDILLGIYWATLTSIVFQVPLNLVWITFGILFALLPDIDFWVEYIRRRGKVGGKTLDQHRVLTHIPLLFLPIGIIIFALAGPAIGVLYFLGVTGHFIHDSVGMGYGYRLLYPYSNLFFKFFSDQDGNVSYTWKHFMIRWTEAEVRALHQKHGNDNWLEDDIRYHLRHWLILLWQFSLVILSLIIIKYLFYV